jgi:rod shape-determining protein MreD
MRWLPFMILACIGVVLQTTVVHRLQINHVSLDLIFILAAYYALNAPTADAKIAAWLLGFSADLVDPGPLGVMAFCFGLTALLVVQFRDTMFRSHPLTSAFVTLFCTWMIHMLAGAFFILTHPEVHRSVVEVVLQATYTAIYTALLAPSIHWMLDRMRGTLGLTPSPRLKMGRSH